MADYGTDATDKRIAKLEARIREVYKQAEKELDDKLKDFTKRFEVKDKIHQEDVTQGRWTPDQYKNWLKGQIFQTKQWKAKKEQVIDTLTRANEISIDLVNAQRSDVFMINANYQAYTLEKRVGLDLGFGVYDTHTAKNLLDEKSDILPKYKINEEKDYIWNSKKVNTAILQGVIQGERLDQIANRLAVGLSAKNMNKMLTFARTGMTQAQNAGRVDRLHEAESINLKVHKEWMATLDEHTRITHRKLDGQKRPTDEAFEVDGYKILYPGDPNAHPSMIFNCRCTLVGDVDGIPEGEYQRYDNVNGMPIENMNYEQWYKSQYSQIHRSAKNFVWNRHYNGIPNRNYGKADTSDALQEIKSGQPNSLSEYMDENGNLTPERIALHKQIIDNYLAGKTPEEKAAIMTMMGGGPASGKSSVLRAGLYQLPDSAHSVTIDPDDIKQYLPGYIEMSKTSNKAAPFYHEESSMLAKQLAATCFTENFNVTYDGTGDGSIGSVMKKLNGAKSHGYQVNGVYVTVDIDEALRRNKKRYEDAIAKGEAPRLVPDAYVINCHKKVTDISMQVSQYFDSIVLYDTNGDKAVLIAKGGNGKKLRAIRGMGSTFKRFLDKTKYGKR